MKDEYTKRTAENWKQFEGMEILVSDSLKGGWVMFKLIIYNRHEIYPFVTTGGNYKYARIKNVKEVEKVCELCDTPITEDTNDCCMGRELEDLERQLEELDKDNRALLDSNLELIKELEEVREDIYKYAEIALMEGKDEFGHSWEDFKHFVLDEQLKEQDDEQRNII